MREIARIVTRNAVRIDLPKWLRSEPYSTFPPKYALASPQWKQLQLTQNFTMHRMFSINVLTFFANMTYGK